MKKLSIIIPIYNVEKYIRACIESIFMQGITDDDFELILVNDGSKDNSMKMISDIISQHKNISIIEQENQGLSVARNNGIAKAQGEYILMPDSDDLLIENSLPILLNTAIQTKADLVVADFLELYDEDIASTHISPQNEDNFHFKKKTGKELFLQDLNPEECYVWRTLFRRHFLIDENIQFVPGVYYQDVPFTHECYLKAHECIRTSWLLNIYRRGRKGSATYSFSIQKAKNLCIVISRTWELTKWNNHTKSTLRKLKNDVYKSFSLLITLTSYSITESAERKRIINYLNQLTPNLFFCNGIKQIATSLFYKTSPKVYINTNYYLRLIKKRLKQKSSA